MQGPFVSIIIITRNRPFLLRHSIERVLSQPYPHKEIIVVDSSSNDESERIVEQYPEVISVRLRGQRNNMPQARNTGITAASGDIVAFIDDDAMVQPGWLAALINAYDDKTVGAVGGRVINMPEPYCDEVRGSPRFQIASGRLTGKDGGVFSAKEIEVDHLIGCNMSFRQEVLEQVGGFDSNYTLTNYCEETDLCMRVKKAGWRIMYIPTMAVMHFSFRTINKPYLLERPLFQFSSGRNGTYFMVKHFGLKPSTLGIQLLTTAQSCGRALFYSSLFVTGLVAQVTGRIVGLGVGIAWHMDSQLRAASAPKVEMRSRARIERMPVEATSQNHHSHE
jgi:GT2 family glycosyltransferase